MALAAAGDGAGVTALYDRHARAMYALALRIVQAEAEAEDVVQEVFAQVFRQAGRYDASRGTVGNPRDASAKARAGGGAPAQVQE